MIKYIIITIVIFLQGYYLSAQQATGGVFEHVNGNEIPLVGATIIQLSTHNGTVTGDDGHFKIDLKPKFPQVLVVSFVSYKTDTINLKQTGYNHVHIGLNEVKNLSEVEIKARQKGSFISRTQIRSVVTINENELQKAACCNLSESFENSATVDVSYSDAVTGAKTNPNVGISWYIYSTINRKYSKYAWTCHSMGIRLYTWKLDGINSGFERDIIGYKWL